MPGNKFLLLILASVGLNAAAQLLLRVGGKSGFVVEGRSLASVFVDVVGRPGILAGLASYAVSIVIWIVVLSRVEASYAYPFLGLGFILVAFGGWFWLDEAMTPMRLLATAIIAVGIILLASN